MSDEMRHSGRSNRAGQSSRESECRDSRVLTDGGASQGDDGGDGVGDIVDDVDQIDMLSGRILAVLDESDGVMDTASLRANLNVDNAELLHYRRREYLEPMGFVESEYPEHSQRGVAPPLRWNLTERGEQAAEYIEGDVPSWDELPRRVELLERELDEMQEVVERGTPVSGREDEATKESVDDTDVGGSIEDRVAALETEMGSLRESVDELASTVESLEDDPVFDSEWRSQLDKVTVSAAISKDVLMEELGKEETFQERLADKVQTLQMLEETPR